MATQKEVAEYAGVSFITVSRVINNTGTVKESTRQRVLEAIQKFKYYPNRQAQALNSGLTRTLGLIVPRMYDLPLLGNFYVMNLLSGVEMMGRRLGWDILLTTDHDKDEDFDFLRVWHQRKIDGLIFIGLRRHPQGQLEEIESSSIPCISVADRIESPAVSWIDTDSEGAISRAISELQGRGHGHLCFVSVDPTIDYNPDILAREAAAREQCTALGIPLDVVAVADSVLGGGTLSARAFLELDPRPTGIIAGNDAAAFDFMDELARHSLQCPRDYSIIGFDGEPAGKFRSPSLASFSQPLVEMGQFATEVLIARIADPGSARVCKVFPLTFVPGDSLGQAPSSMD